MDYQKTCENNSVGRVLSFQVRCRGFESRFSLQYKMRRKLKWNGNAWLRTKSLRVRISLGAPNVRIGPMGKAAALKAGIALIGLITDVRRRFESFFWLQKCECNSVGRVPSFQVGCRGFKSRLSLQ